MQRRPLRILLDTSALNWLTDHPEEAIEFFAARTAGFIEALVTPEAANEIRRTKDPDRLAALKAVLARFFPLTPTRLPRLGAFRLGMARHATESDVALFDSLNFLRDGQDRNLATNAAGYRCDLFVTCDREMSSQKRAKVGDTARGHSDRGTGAASFRTSSALSCGPTHV
jgi:hypothetical protein